LVNSTELLDLPLAEAAKVAAHVRPRDADEFFWWVKSYTGYHLPRKAVCDGHVAPLVAVWKVFQEEILDAVFFANRSGGKTVSMAILNLVDLLFKPGCEIASVGAILPQARKGYKYLQQMLQSPLFRDDVVEILMRETSLSNGSSVEIVSSTASGLNCLVGETTIHTCDGNVPIKDLVGRSGFFVPAYDREAGRFTVDRVLRVWKVGSNAPVYRVMFDNDILLATADHPVMLIDGSYRAVRDLRTGDRLVPFERWIRADSGNWYWIMALGNRQFVKQSRLVAEAMLGRPLERDEQVHHGEAGTLCDQPWNLQVMRNGDHARLTNQGENNFWYGKKRPGHAEFMRRYIEQLKEHGLYDERFERLRETWARKSPEEKAAFARAVQERVKREWQTPERRAAQQRSWRNKYSSADDERPWTDFTTMFDLYVVQQESMPKIAQRLGCSLRTVSVWLGRLGISPRSISEGVRLANAKNHRVVSVEFHGYADVYDMQTEKHHNFIANGIAVHNSPHPMKARADEIELMDWDSVQQFFSMAVSAPGICAQQVLSSTRKTLTGSMQKLLDRCEKDPSFSFQVLPWCIWETIERCDLPDCTGCEKVVRSDGQSFAEACGGKAHQSDGFYGIEDAWRKFKLLDPDVWDAEWEGKKPSKGGLVVGKQWDDNVHWQPWVVYNPALASYGGIDFGYDAPFAAAAGQINGVKDLFGLNELYGSELSLQHQIIPVLREMQEMYNVRLWWCDATNPMQIRDLREAGIRAVPCTRDKKASYELVRSYLKGHVTGKPRLVLSQQMENIRRDFLLCHFVKGQADVVANEYSHGVDAVAYLLWGITHKLGGTNQGSGELPVSGGDGRGTVRRRHRV
jgi:hypothetical protein